MNINEKKSGIAKHGGMEIPDELTNKYPLITKENRYRYLGLHIYEVNENSENEEFIITKINETHNELEPLDVNNRTIIKCINTQVMGQIRYYIGSVIFTVGCLESVDIIIRRWLKNKDYIHINQNVHRLYIKENVFGSWLISARDLQLKTLVKLYLEEKEREVDEIFRRSNEMLEDKRIQEHC